MIAMRYIVLSGHSRCSHTSVRAKPVRDLQRHWAAAIEKLEDGDSIEPTRTTFGEYLTYWLDTYARHNVRPTTYRSYEQLIRLHTRHCGSSHCRPACDGASCSGCAGMT